MLAFTRCALWARDKCGVRDSVGIGEPKFSPQRVDVRSGRHLESASVRPLLVTVGRTGWMSWAALPSRFGPRKGPVVVSDRPQCITAGYWCPAVQRELVLLGSLLFSGNNVIVVTSR